jgi:hypothetical protein
MTKLCNGLHGAAFRVLRVWCTVLRIIIAAHHTLSAIYMRLSNGSTLLDTNMANASNYTSLPRCQLLANYLLSPNMMLLRFSGNIHSLAFRFYYHAWGLFPSSFM